MSSPGYRAAGWYPAGPRSTVLVALLADGVYADPVPLHEPAEDSPGQLQGPVVVPRGLHGRGHRPAHRPLDFSGVVSAADVHVNGRRVAPAAQVTGAYTHHELDITALVRRGTNTVAFRVRPNDPNKDLTMGWLDWLQPPPDRNMGLVRDVLVRRGGPVALRDAHVVMKLAVPSLATAELTVEAQARNDTGETGHGGGQRQRRRHAVQPDGVARPARTKTVAFSPADVPGLRLTEPKVWWPAGMGGRPAAVRPRPHRHRGRHGVGHRAPRPSASGTSDPAELRRRP